jgi:glyoxalase family protein
MEIPNIEAEMSETSVAGIHHITAIASEPQQNVEFYTRVLGLRLVKQTVNFDDPTTYHLYYGDEVGSPGTILTFFPWAGLPKGRRGTGQATAISLSVPVGSLGYWRERLQKHTVVLEGPGRRFEEEVLAFTDPDGLQLELVAAPGLTPPPSWSEGPVPSEHAIGGIHSVALEQDEYDRTASFLIGVLGFRSLGEEGDRFRFGTGRGEAAALVDLIVRPRAASGRMGTGSIHHVAWRAGSDEEQRRWRERLIEAGVGATTVIDRRYFRSIYFREPGGVLFEIATDAPGFTVDETVEKLGGELKLPPWLEPRRSMIEQALPPMRTVLGMG